MKFGEGRRIELIAKTIVDIGKAVFVLGLASRFFEQFTLSLRILFSVFSIAFIFAGFALYPDKGGDK